MKPLYLLQFLIWLADSYLCLPLIEYQMLLKSHKTITSIEHYRYEATNYGTSVNVEVVDFRQHQHILWSTLEVEVKQVEPPKPIKRHPTLKLDEFFGGSWK